MRNLFASKSIRGKLVFSFFSISFLLLIITTGIVYTVQVDSIKKQATSKLIAIRDLKIGQINIWVDERLSDLHVIAKLNIASHFISHHEDSKKKLIFDTEQQYIEQFLSDFRKSYRSYDEIFYTDLSSGKILFSSNKNSVGKRKLTPDNIRDILDNDQVLIEDIYHSQTLNKPVMRFSEPIKNIENKDKTIGIVTAVIDLEASLYKLLSNRTGLGETGETLIVNSSVYAISHLKSYDDAALKLKIDALPAIYAANGASGTIEADDYAGDKVLAAFSYLPKLKWGFVAKQNQSEIFVAVDLLLNRLFFIIVFSIPIIYLISFSLANTITRPLLRLSDKSTELMHGNFTERNEILGQDEIASLERNFDSMAVNIQNYLAQLHESEDKLRLVTENVKEIFWLFNVQTNKLLYISPQYQNITGKSLELILENPEEWLNSVFSADRERVIAARANLKNYNEEYRFYRSNGKVIWLHEESFPVLNKKGELYRIVGVATDITDLKQNQQQLELAKIEADSANEAKSRFLANMSHEIRTPLNAIIGFAYLLQNDPLTDFQRKQLTKQNEAANHLLQIINDILDLSKIDAGMMDLQNEDINIEHLLTKVFSLVHNKASEKRIEFSLDLDHVPLFLKGDTLRIEQVLINLVSNAVKFTEQGSVSIHIGTLEETEDNILVRFEVIDTGIGIQPQVLDQIFESFEQADGSITRTFGGTGLGLTISKKIIHLMGGKIGVTSQFGEGSTFWFEITLNKSAVQQDTLADLSQFTDKRLLVVDDLFEARESLQGILQRFNFYTETTSSGDNAIRLIEQADQQGMPFHLVLLDWKMPEMDGSETATRIRTLALTIKPKIIFVTAYADQLDKLKIANLSDAVVTKPVLPSVLQDRLLSVFHNETINTVQMYDQSVQGKIITFNDVHILLVEDNPINQDVAIGLLKNVGITVDLAENGLVAFNMAKENQYDLILMDLQMPVWDGFQATLAIRELPQMKDIPILAMTANAFSDDKEQCMQVGMNAHIAKPVSPNQLYKTLADYLPKKNLFYTDNEVDNHTPPNESVIEQLETIDGLDVQRGLCNAGNDVVFYLGLLKKFVKQYNQEFSSCLIENAANFQQNVYQLAHALKGSAATLGVVNIQNLAKLLEEEAKTIKQSSLLILQVEAMKDELKKFELAINSVSEVSQVVPEQVKIDRQQIKPLINELESLLKTGDAVATELFKNNKGSFEQAFGSAIETLENQIDSFDFSGALMSLRVLGTSLKQRSSK